MGQRRVLMVIAALLAAIALVAGGCGGDKEEKLTGTDADENAPAEAQDVIRNALETMFTWYPGKDTSTLDGYKRASKYLGQKLRDAITGKPENSPDVHWMEWDAADAVVTAKALLVAGEHPKDTADQVVRPVTLTQVVKTPDGKELDSFTMQIDRVVAKKGPDGFRVEEIEFFAATGKCQEGQTRQAPDAPCAPPPKQCPDGTTVPADQDCPSRSTPPTPPTTTTTGGSGEPPSPTPTTTVTTTVPTTVTSTVPSPTVTSAITSTVPSPTVTSTVTETVTGAPVTEYCYAPCY